MAAAVAVRLSVAKVYPRPIVEVALTISQLRTARERLNLSRRLVGGWLKIRPRHLRRLEEGLIEPSVWEEAQVGILLELFGRAEQAIGETWRSRRAAVGQRQEDFCRQNGLTRIQLSARERRESGLLLMELEKLGLKQ